MGGGRSRPTLEQRIENGERSIIDRNELFLKSSLACAADCLSFPLKDASAPKDVGKMPASTADGPSLVWINFGRNDRALGMPDSVTFVTVDSHDAKTVKDMHRAFCLVRDADDDSYDWTPHRRITQFVAGTDLYRKIFHDTKSAVALNNVCQLVSVRKGPQPWRTDPTVLPPERIDPKLIKIDDATTPTWVAFPSALQQLFSPALDDWYTRTAALQWSRSYKSEVEATMARIWLLRLGQKGSTKKDQAGKYEKVSPAKSWLSHAGDWFEDGKSGSSTSVEVQKLWTCIQLSRTHNRKTSSQFLGHHVSLPMSDWTLTWLYYRAHASSCCKSECGVVPLTSLTIEFYRNLPDLAFAPEYRMPFTTNTLYYAFRIVVLPLYANTLERLDLVPCEAGNDDAKKTNWAFWMVTLCKQLAAFPRLYHVTFRNMCAFNDDMTKALLDKTNIEELCLEHVCIGNSADMWNCWKDILSVPGRSRLRKFVANLTHRCTAFHTHAYRALADVISKQATWESNDKVAVLSDVHVGPGILDFASGMEGDIGKHEHRIAATRRGIILLADQWRRVFDNSRHLTRLSLGKLGDLYLGEDDVFPTTFDRTKLQSLSMSCNTSLWKQVVRPALCHGLKELNLSADTTYDNRTVLHDLAVASLSRTFPLESLSLSLGCPYMSGDPWTSVATCLPKLTCLHLSMMLISDRLDQVQATKDLAHGLGHFRCLRALRIQAMYTSDLFDGVWAPMEWCDVLCTDLRHVESFQIIMRSVDPKPLVPYSWLERHCDVDERKEQTFFGTSRAMAETAARHKNDDEWARRLRSYHSVHLQHRIPPPTKEHGALACILRRNRSFARETLRFCHHHALLRLSKKVCAVSTTTRTVSRGLMHLQDSVQHLWGGVDRFVGLGKPDPEFIEAFLLARRMTNHE